MRLIAGFHARYPRAWRGLPVALFVALVWLRLPGIMRHGRFWAEEGTVFFHNAWTMPWWQALLKPEMGYLNLPANAAAILAYYIVPLRQAPHIVNIVSLALQTLPILQLAVARDFWLRRPIVLTAAAILLATPPLQEEVWLNTPNSQVHVALAAAFCLGLNIPAGRPTTWAMRMFLLLVPLSSPVAAILTPLFWARGILERNHGRLIQAACMTAGSILQFGMFTYTMPSRTHALTLSILTATIAVKQFAVPFLSQDIASGVASALRGDVTAGHFPVLAAACVSLTLAALAGAIVLRRNIPAAWLILTAGLLAFIAYYNALGSGLDLIDTIFGQRYGFAPSCLLGITSLALAAEMQGRIRWIARGTTLWLLMIAGWHTLHPNTSIFASGPLWKTEVAMWNANSSHALAIWPSGWFITLPGR